jgi:hypothetical protein
MLLTRGGLSCPRYLATKQSEASLMETLSNLVSTLFDPADRFGQIK